MFDRKNSPNRKYNSEIVSQLVEEDPVCQIERPPQTAPSSEMQRVQKANKNNIIKVKKILGDNKDKLFFKQQSDTKLT